jgi:Pyruvate phosphate dikinase, AMP/ATP-binding domain
MYVQQRHSFRRALVSNWRRLGRPVVRRPEHFNFGRETRKCGRGCGKVLGVLVFRALCAVQEVMALSCYYKTESSNTFINRQYGQKLNPGMAVVVQVMVPAEVAGVLFTRHPFTGNPRQAVVTANYGLGEV